MNKLISKIVGVCLGLSLATGVGVGVAVGQNNVREAKADTTVVDFALSSASSTTSNGVTVSFDKGSGATNPTWYSAGLRLYAKNTVSVSLSIASKSITNIVFDWEKQGNKDFATVTASAGTYSHPTQTGEGTWTGSATSITFTLGSSGQLQLNTLHVTYGDGSAEPNADYDYFFNSKMFSSNTSVTLADGSYSPSWSLNATFSSGSYYGGSSTDGQQIGSGSNTCSGGTLSTTSFAKAVTKIAVTNRCKTSGTISAYVGGTQVGNAANVGSAFSESVFTAPTGSQLTGEIKFTWTNTNAAFYFREIKLWLADATTVHVSSIEIGTDFSLAKGQTQTIVPTITPANATNQSITYTSSDLSIATVDNDGKVTAVDVGSATITGVSADNSSATDSLVVTVTKHIPTSLSWTKQLKDFEVGASLDTYFDSNNNVIKVKYSDGETSNAIAITDSSLSIKLGNNVISSDYVLQLSDNGKQLEITYIEDNVSVSQKIGITVNEPLVLGPITKNFAGEKAYLLVDDYTSSLSGSYTSLYGEPTLNVSTSNEQIIDVDDTYNSNTYDEEAKTGTFTIGLLAYDVGTASITIELACNGKTVSTTYGPILVRASDPTSGGSHYEKVTSTSDIVDGQYLFVFEEGSVAFDGGLTSMDVTNNTIEVSILNNQIPYNTTTAAAQFTIDTAEQSVLSASGLYIYGASGSNILNTTEDFETAGETLMSISDGNAIFKSKTTTTLAFNNASNQQRFRYFKSTTTISDTGNQVRYIQLYKLIEEEVENDFDKALEFVNTFMHTEISVSDNGTGQCISAGWYTAAKAAFLNTSSSTATGYLQSAAQRAIVADSFSDYFARLQAWAAANGEEFELSDGDYIVVTASNRILPAFGDENSAAIPAIVVVIALATVTTGAYFFLRKKKEN